MPIYEYRCPECGHAQEAMVRVAAADATRVCDRCGTAMTRVPSVFAVSGRREAAQGTACCGLESPCSDPKRCCEQ